MKKQYAQEELLRYKNHPLAAVRQFCPKCDGQMQAPAYPGDYFDCMDCGHSISPTQKQINIMANPPKRRY